MGYYFLFTQNISKLIYKHLKVGQIVLNSSLFLVWETNSVREIVFYLY